jgi:hypothetical protein
MEWKGRRQSANIEDRRRAGSRGVVAGGGIGLLAVLAIGYFLGIDVTPLLDEQGLGGQAPAELTEADIQAGEFVSVVLNDTEEIWSGIFEQQIGQPYTPTTLVLYKGVTQSACGGASGATGPFYCPGDRQDLSRHGFLRHARPAARRGRRFRGGLCRRARGRAPRAGRVGDPVAGQRHTGPRRRGGGERDLGPHRAAGRLLRGDLGALCRGAARHAGARRHRRRR